MMIKNALYYAPDGKFRKGSISAKNGRLLLDADVSDKETFNAEGYRVIPGLIDIHTHGALGIDTMEADKGQFIELSRFYAKNGVTSFMPTTITAGTEAIEKVLAAIKDAAMSGQTASSIVGVHIEGPYINPKQKGCHDEQLICPPKIENFTKFAEILGDSLKLRFTVAPEMDGALDFIGYVCKNGGLVTIGHTEAVYKECGEAVSRGANCFTHLFNAMRGLHHREPGVVGSALLSDAYAEIICDGIHLHPDIVKLAYKIKGIEKTVLITDSMRATGSPDGAYLFGGMEITVKEGIARTHDGTLAGSTLLLFDGLKNFIRFTGEPLEKVLPAATINPAKVIGIDNVTGSIENGKRADLLVVDDNLNIIATIIGGRIVYGSLPS